MTPGTRAAITVTGRVQGVGYRMWALRLARNLGLSGFVRNHTDGSVYIEIEGDHYSVMRMVSLCSDGPPTSHVSDVSYVLQPPLGSVSFIIQ